MGDNYGENNADDVAVEMANVKPEEFRHKIAAILNEAYADGFDEGLFTGRGY